MIVNDKDLMAYADGELDGVKRAEIVQALLTDAELRERLAQHQALSELTRMAFKPPTDMSDGLSMAMAGLDGPIPANDGSEKRPLRWMVPTAALVLAGVMFVASLSGPSTGNAFIIADGETLSAGPILTSALNASLPMPTTQEIRVERSFKSDSDQYCRQFRYSAKTHARGLACKVGEDWNIAIFAEIMPTPDGSFLPASGEIDPVSIKALELGIKHILNTDEVDKAARQNWQP